ncbi:MAG: fumarylacetoacetate hydrolase family protein [Ferrovibrionaceae bacterium]
MRFVTYAVQGKSGLAIEKDGRLYGVRQGGEGFPGTLDELLQNGGDLKAAHAAIEQRGEALDADAITYLPPFQRPSKIICVGLNYADHTKESPYEQPAYPTLFARFPSSLIGHRAAIVRPRASEQLDYEGEMVAVLGQGGRHVAPEKALDLVAGYSVFNEASIRDYQFKSPQWTVGKNFDGTGAFGPAFVTADELPAGGSGLHIETRLNGQVMQSATTADMLFDVRTVISVVSEAITLWPGDVLVMGTPAGVGFGRKPPLFMRHGDVCEVEIEGIGKLVNPIRDETA